MFLTDIKPGCKAKILNTEGVSDIVRRRLMDMGIMDGASVMIKRILPFGGPIAVEVCGQWIGLRRCEANRIEVAQT